MKLIKLTNYHYIIVDNSEIKVNDWFFNTVQGNIYCNNIPDYNVNKDYLKKITHSTQPLSDECKFCTGDCYQCVDGIKPISLKEIKELIGEVDVEKKTNQYLKNNYPEYLNPKDKMAMIEDYKTAYNQALEDNKDKKYTEEDMKVAITQAFLSGVERLEDFERVQEMILDNVKPKTEWEVEFIDGKIKLK